MNSKINDKEMALNINLLLASSSHKKGQKLGKPEGVVANWSCTRLYKKASWRGRLWQLIRCVTRTQKKSLKRTIEKTATAARNSVEHMEKLLNDVNQPGLLGSYWKDRTVAVVRAEVKRSIKFRNRLEKVTQKGWEHLSRAVSWADSTANTKAGEETAAAIKQFASDETLRNLKKAESKTDKAALCVEKIKEMGVACSVEVLYRELLSTYPRTDEDLRKRRDALQRESLRYKPRDGYGKETQCPERLLYAPLVAVAREFADRTVSLREVETLLNDLMVRFPTDEMQHNGQLLLKMIAYLRDPDSNPAPKIPTSVLTGLQDQYWLKGCSLNKTTAASFIRCERGKHTKYHVIPEFSYGFSSNNSTRYSLSGHQYIPYTVHTHHKTYYHFEKLQDGAERIGVDIQVNRCGP